MAKIYKNVNGDYVEVEQSLNPDVLAAKLVQDPIYRFISKDQSHTSEMLTYLLLGLLILPFVTSALIWFHVSPILAVTFFILNLVCYINPTRGIPIMLLMNWAFYYFVT